MDSREDRSSQLLIRFMTLLTRYGVCLLLAATLSGCALNPFSRGKTSKERAPKESEVASSVNSSAARSSIPSNELMIVQEFLDENNDEYQFYYAEMEGRRYQWILTRHVDPNRILYHFRSGAELGANGQTIAGSESPAVQYFTIALDPDTLQVDRLYSGR